MKKSLLLDADVVIDLHALSLFEKISKAYNIKLTRQVSKEAKYYYQGDERIPIDIGQKVTIIKDVAVECLQMVQEGAKKAILSIDPGETTLIACLLQGREDTTLCLFDEAAIKLISYMGLEKKAISLEKALRNAGHHIKLNPKYSESRFSRLIKKGKELRVYDMRI
jgi:hypothetical protein